MQSAALNYKLIRKIKDERFDVDLINEYELLIHIGARDLQVGVVDTREDRLLLLEDFVFPSLRSQQELQEVLIQLFDDHDLLTAGFWKQITISFKNNRFAQVPEILFVEESRHEYLRLNARFDPEKDLIRSVSSKRAGAVTVFSIPRDFEAWFSQLYPRVPVTYIHQSAVLIEGVIEVSRKKKDNPLYIYVDRFKLHIIAAREGKLIYYNQFVIKQFSEYIKYIMLVMKTLRMPQESSQVVLWGYIGRNSPHYQEFLRYINNVVFGDRPKFLKYAYMFDEVQDHHFFDLYNMYLTGR